MDSRHGHRSPRPSMLPIVSVWHKAALVQLQSQSRYRLRSQSLPVPLSRLGRTSCSHSSDSMSSQHTKSSLDQILFVESGFGCDQHGQNATVSLPWSTAVLASHCSAACSEYD